MVICSLTNVEVQNNRFAISPHISELNSYNANRDLEMHQGEKIIINNNLDLSKESGPSADA
jgi:hypothetical protein